MTPAFVDYPETKIVGMGARFISVLSPDGNNSTVIPKLWHDFIQRENEIHHRKPGVSFGLCDELPKEQQTGQKGELFYIAAVEVSQIEAVPSGMISQVIPAGRYAVFTHRGFLNTLCNTMNAIYQEWLPGSGMKLRPKPHIERYDRRFNPNSKDSEFDICLPMK